MVVTSLPQLHNLDIYVVAELMDSFCIPVQYHVVYLEKKEENQPLLIKDVAQQ